MACMVLHPVLPTIAATTVCNCSIFHHHRSTTIMRLFHLPVGNMAVCIADTSTNKGCSCHWDFAICLLLNNLGFNNCSIGLPCSIIALLTASRIPNNRCSNSQQLLDALLMGSLLPNICCNHTQQLIVNTCTTSFFPNNCCNDTQQLIDASIMSSQLQDNCCNHTKQSLDGLVTASLLSTNCHNNTQRPVVSFGKVALLSNNCYNNTEQLLNALATAS